MALCSCRKAQQHSVRHNDLNMLANSVQRTPTALSNAGPPDVSVPTPAPTKRIEEKVLYRLVPSSWRQSSATRRLPRKPSRSVRIMSIPLAPLAPTVPCLRLCSFVIGSAIIGISTSVKTRQWLFCLGLSLKLSFVKVWVTQRLLCISPGVALDKTPSITGRKFTIGYLTSSILNPSGLMLTELQKSPTSFDSLEENSSFRSRLRWNNAGRSSTIGTH